MFGLEGVIVGGKFGRRIQLLTAFGAFTGTVLFFQNCGQPVQFSQVAQSLDNGGLGDPIVQLPSQSLGVFSSEQYVCEPFGSGGGGSATSGLKGRLKYLDRNVWADAGQANGVTISKYYNSSTLGIVSPIQDLYFSQINVPTRSFTSGFQSNNGNSILDTQGNVLTEYFSIEYNALLRLGVNDPAGHYRVGIISDDGSTVEIKVNGQWQTLINNDRTQSTHMECASNLIQFDKQSQIPLRVRYYQGPRTEIANVLVWKYESNGQVTPEEQCGKGGNGIEARGWEVIKPENFVLPDEEVNPCTTQVNMEAKNLKLSEDAARNVIFSFSSTQAAQVSYSITNEVGQQVTAGQESGESLSHTLMLGPIAADQQYTVSVTLKSSSLGVSIKRSFVVKPVPN